MQHYKRIQEKPVIFTINSKIRSRRLVQSPKQKTDLPKGSSTRFYFLRNLIAFRVIKIRRSTGGNNTASVKTIWGWQPRGRPHVWGHRRRRRLSGWSSGGGSSSEHSSVEKGTSQPAVPIYAALKYLSLSTVISINGVGIRKTGTKNADTSTFETPFSFFCRRLSFFDRRVEKSTCIRRGNFISCVDEIFMLPSNLRSIRCKYWNFVGVLEKFWADVRKILYWCQWVAYWSLSCRRNL